MSSLYVPGRGMVNLAATRVDRAVNEYDERLLFAQNPENQQWCIMIKLPPDHVAGDGIVLDGTTRVLPILGFQDIPHPEDALKRLYQTDTMRWGEEILNQINRHNDEVKAEKEREASDASGEAAEALEWFRRNEGTHPQARVFVPGDKD